MKTIQASYPEFSSITHSLFVDAHFSARKRLSSLNMCCFGKRLLFFSFSPFPNINWKCNLLLSYTYIFFLLAVTLHTVTFLVSYYLSEAICCCCFVIAIAIINIVIIICILYEDQGAKVMAIEIKK